MLTLCKKDIPLSFQIIRENCGLIEQVIIPSSYACKLCSHAYNLSTK